MRRHLTDFRPYRLIAPWAVLFVAAAAQAAPAAPAPSPLAHPDCAKPAPGAQAQRTPSVKPISARNARDGTSGQARPAHAPSAAMRRPAPEAAPEVDHEREIWRDQGVG